jgi:hypothetical protein
MQLPVKNIFVALLLSGVIFSCKEINTGNHPGSFPPQISSAIFNSVPDSDIVIPQQHPIDERHIRKVKAGKPVIVSVETNRHPTGNPKMVTAGRPKPIVPGTDTFLAPRKIPVVCQPIIGELPETYVAKGMSYKSTDPYSFASFGKLHGLRNNIVTSLLCSRPDAMKAPAQRESFLFARAPS